jgi:hypothetical protein
MKYLMGSNVYICEEWPGICRVFSGGSGTANAGTPNEIQKDPGAKAKDQYSGSE